MKGSVPRLRAGPANDCHNPDYRNEQQSHAQGAWRSQNGKDHRHESDIPTSDENMIVLHESPNLLRVIDYMIRRPQR